MAIRNEPKQAPLTTETVHRALGIREAARVAGVSVGAVSNWARGLSKPSRLSLRALAAAGITYTPPRRPK